jgi:glucose-1-phosphatase
MQIQGIEFKSRITNAEATVAQMLNNAERQEPFVSRQKNIKKLAVCGSSQFVLLLFTLPIMTQTKNIIFDLGGVLLNIDFSKSVEAFGKLGIENFEHMFSQTMADELFKSLETGHVDETAFYESMKKRTRIGVTDAEIADAWNALILDFRPESLAALEKLSSNYKLFLLSNTNSIHHTCFQKILTRVTGKASLDGYFTKAWYSHKLGLRKPGSAIYEYILEEEKLRAWETLFIDDTWANIEAAQKLGFKTHHLLPGEKIENILQ